MTKAPPLSVRFPAEVRERLADAAANEGLTVNRLIVDLVRDGLDRLDGTVELRNGAERTVAVVKENPRVPRPPPEATPFEKPRMQQVGKTERKPAVVALPGGRPFKGPDPK